MLSMEADHVTIDWMELRTHKIASHIRIGDEQIVLLVSILGPDGVLVQYVRYPITVRQIRSHRLEGGHYLGFHHRRIGGQLEACI